MPSSLLALLDDISALLDDVATLTKVAAKQTAGVLGDDLALNAQQVSGVAANRELPVVWAVAKGSLLNKAILVPCALLISAFAPWAVMPLLMIGGAYLCFEGVEKLVHRRGHAKDHAGTPAASAPGEVAAASAPVSGEGAAAASAPGAGAAAASAPGEVAAAEQARGVIAAAEKAKVRGAIRTDFILSAEIVVIALGTVAAAPFVTRVLVLVGIALAMTAGVYGFVAGIVKLDDLGLLLSRRAAPAARGLGRGILRVAPLLMKTLSVVGTAAMFLVGGGILVHGVHALQPWLDSLTRLARGVPAVGGALGWAAPLVVNGLAGVLAGALVLLAVKLAQKIVAGVRARRAS